MTQTALRGARFVVLIISLLSVQNVCFAGPQRWIEARSPHFVVVTNASERDARQVVDQFELIRAVFREYFRSVSTNDQPVIIIAAKDEGTLKPLLPDSWTKKGAAHRTGIFVSGQDKSYVALRLDVSLNESAYEPYEPIYHEYVHYLMRRITPQLPRWMVEGLAEFYGNVRVESKKVLVGTPSVSNLGILSQKTLLPLSTLFAVDASSPYYNEENKISIFYAESWALTHYLMARDWKANTNRVGDFTALLLENVPQTDAARRTIGDPAALQGALNEYIHMFAFTAARLERPKIEQGDYQVQPLSDAESLAVRADFMAHEGEYARAQNMLEESVKLDPKLAAAYESMSFLYFQQQGKKPDAEKWSAEAVALNPESYIANYYYGASLLRDILPNDGTVATAEASLRAAVKINAGFAPAYDALAYCLARPGSHQNLDEAHEMALKAVQQDPSDVGHRVRLVEVLLAISHTDEAIKEANMAVSMARTPADQSAASGALEAAQKFQVSQKKMKELQEAQASGASAGTTAISKPQEPTAGAGAQGGVHVLSDTMGVNFDPYLKGIVPIVNKNWHSLLPPTVFPPISKSGTVSIEFAIMKDGTVAGMKLAGTSADPPLERACWASITNSAPFPPLPKEFPGQYLQLRFIYCYNDACHSSKPNVPVGPSKNPANSTSPSD